MSPPPGATLVRDLTTAGSWTSESGGSLEQLQERGPTGDPVLRSTLVDGQDGAPSGLPSERNDLQGGTVPLGSVRWMTWSERFVRVPDPGDGAWQLIGPAEIHGETLPQAPVMPQVGPDERRRLAANAGRAAPRVFDVGPLDVGSWHSYKLGIRYTDGDDGWLELWRDGVRVVRLDGPTTSEQRDGYWKLGHYRDARIDGRSVYDVSGVRVYAPTPAT